MRAGTGRHVCVSTYIGPGLLVAGVSCRWVGCVCWDGVRLDGGLRYGESRAG